MDKDEPRAVYKCRECGAPLDGLGRPIRTIGCMACDPDIQWLMHDSADPADWPPGYGEAIPSKN